MDKTALRRIFNRIIRDIVYRLIHFVIVKQNRAKFCLMIVNIYNNILCIRNRCKFFSSDLTICSILISTSSSFSELPPAPSFVSTSSLSTILVSLSTSSDISPEVFLYHSRIGIFRRNKTVAYKFYASHRGFKFV